MSDLQDKAYVFGTIFTLSNKLQILGDQLDTKLTVKQWLFLAGISKCESQAPTLSELAVRIGSSRQNVKKMAVILEKQGFIVMNRDGKDARMLRVSMTDFCKEYLGQREQVELIFIEEMFEGFEPQELEALSGAIRKIEKNINTKMQNNAEKES
jgi:DNA-binding MarR family transcriptional regulator